ncbi:alanyl-tRNA editing protein [Rhodoferax antarcticus]|uniref:Alanine--tRNA ligase n=1 Tax=Rhodoferax antarcticus ANT.BR TaxID=1111071 RepID=A0A1Q8YJB4_9BURK|nr:alanyl-tRNA editing protein [Rhodoferax antarcticus]APW48506.1 Ala-tRNA(Pro) hydrolase [Rhodoferax antarcticus]OLP08148.1 threonyl and alanyl tRNA synthetase second additional domain protein [Rhodoferax antarcticus ANT.BR]
MTQDLFRQDAYLTECTATVTAITAQGIVLDRTVFYPLGGGQAGDTGVLVLADGSTIAITDTRKGKAEDGSFTKEICHQPLPELLEQLLTQEQGATPPLRVGDTVTARIDWARRHRMMRFHTASHLLCHILPKLVNGCSITPVYARIDFNMTEALDKEALSAAIAELVAAAHPVSVGTLLDAELDANPALVKSMSVQPPRGSGQIRTIRIGTATAHAAPIDQVSAEVDKPAVLIDLQPCGGTHVANTAEIGAVIVTKIEKKSAMTRRVVLGFAP